MKYKGSTDTKKVLLVIEDCALLSHVDHHDDASGWRTFKEIEENYDLPKEQWEPKSLEKCWIIDVTGIPKEITWFELDNKHCEKIKDFLGVYKTRVEAEAAALKIKNLLRE